MNINLCYGYQETEEGIFHAFEAHDPSNLPDCDVTAKNLAALLDTTPDDDRFNWNEMDIKLPDSVVRKIQNEAVERFVNLQKGITEKIDPAETDYEVRLVGSDAVGNFPTHGWKAAVALLTEKFDDSISKHDNGSWFDEMTLDVDGGNFMITGEEFFQYGDIVPVNKKPGFLHTIEEIRRYSNRAGTFAQCYEYELQDMQGVYDDLNKICNLADELESALTRKYEQSYIDQLSALTGAVQDDVTMSDADKKKVDSLIAQLQDVLWKYSA